MLQRDYCFLKPGYSQFDSLALVNDSAAERQYAKADCDTEDERGKLDYSGRISSSQLSYCSLEILEQTFYNESRLDDSNARRYYD